MALTGDEAVGHLLRRAGFGLAPDDAPLWRKLGYRGAVRRLLDELDEPLPPEPPDFDPYEPGTIQQVWLDRMAGGKAPLAEKLAFFWHGHFATSNVKIQEPALMWRQYRLFRSKGAGRFDALVLDVSRDVAMIRWLDGNANRKGQANENYARELQELFTLGIGNYTETDIREIARAFTGWGSRHHDFVFSDEFHDHGEKTVHGKTGDLDGTDVVAILTALPACRAFIATKLLRFFSHGDPTPGEVAEIAEVLEATGGDIRSALFAMFLSPSFLDEKRLRCLVKGPVEVCVGGLRGTGIRETPLWVHGSLERMGQILFRPPSVKGWPDGTAWLTSAAVVERMKAARRLAQMKPSAAAWIVDIAFDGQAPPELRKALEAAAGEERVALALASPEYQLA
ncbi:MAG TPA: DUF1800 domain-containing protein [Planctomycetota bacterium]|nr:DUF1800 domain-containing protein [Planctomycetota bacterium]